MKKKPILRGKLPLVMVALVSVLILLVSCKDDDDTKPDPPVPVPVPVPVPCLPVPPVAVFESVIAIGKQGTVLVSADEGENWSKATLPTSGSGTHVVYGKGKLYMVGDGPSGFVVTSSDEGNTWTNIQTPATSKLNHITFNNDLFIAAGHKGNLLTSTDGENWEKVDVTEILSFAPSLTVEVIFNKIIYENNSIIVVGTLKIQLSGSPTTRLGSTIIESTDGGSTWAKVENLGGEGFTDIAYNNNGKFIALGSNGKNTGIATKDGDVWTYDGRGGQPRIYSPIIYGKDKFAAIMPTSSIGFFQFSFLETSGWVAKSKRIANFVPNAILYNGNDSYVLLGSVQSFGSTAGGIIQTSTDNGETWTRSTELENEHLGIGGMFNAGTFSKEKFIITGHINHEFGNNRASVIYTSDNGTDWQEAQMPLLTLEETITRIY